MTNPLIGEPLLKITYYEAKHVRLLASNSAMHARYVKGVLIAASDMQTLQALKKRNIIIRLESPGLPSYQGRVQQILKRLVPVPTTGFWYLPTTLTGPLRQSGEGIRRVAG